MHKAVRFFVFVAVLAVLMANTELAGDETPSIISQMAKGLRNGILSTAYHPMPAIAVYETEHFCSTECQEFRQEFGRYLATPNRLPNTSRLPTLLWEIHCGQDDTAHVFYVLLYDRKTIKVWQAKLGVESDREKFFQEAVQLMESNGTTVPDGFEVFQLKSAPD